MSLGARPLVPVPSLDALADGRVDVTTLPVETRAALAHQVADLLASLARDLGPETAGEVAERVAGVQARLMIRAMAGNGQAASQAGEDHLLTVVEVAQRLGVSKDTVYAKRWPFEVAQGGVRARRFSAQGLDRYIRQRMGRETV